MAISSKNRTLIMQTAMGITALVLAFVWTGATRERAAYKRDWQTYQTATRLVDQERKYAEAEPLFAGLLLRYPDSSILHFRRGYTLATENRHQEALAEYERARELDPFVIRDGNYLLLAGDSFFRIGEDAKARAYLKASLEKGDLSPDLTAHANAVLNAIEKKGKP